MRLGMILILTMTWKVGRRDNLQTNKLPTLPRIMKSAREKQIQSMLPPLQSRQRWVKQVDKQRRKHAKSNSNIMDDLVMYCMT